MEIFSKWEFNDTCFHFHSGKYLIFTETTQFSTLEKKVKLNLNIFMCSDTLSFKYFFLLLVWIIYVFLFTQNIIQNKGFNEQ
jgi:hypothetical protein